MKKHWLLALLMAMAFVFAGCSGLIDGIVGNSDDDDDASSSSGTKSLTITVDNYPDVIDTSSSSARLSANISRMITSTSYKNAGDSLAFWVYGTSSDGDSLKPTSVSFTVGDNAYSGTVTLDITAANWYLSLVAVVGTTDYSGSTDSSTLLADAVLIGRANVDLRTGSAASFTLTTDGLTKAAAVTLTLDDASDWWKTFYTALDDTNKGYWKVKAGIYNRASGVDVTITGDESGTPTESNDFASNLGTDGTYEYKLDSMAAGTYLFMVKFVNSNTNKTFIWSDIIRILPGKALTDTITIPNIIGTVPTKPETLTAQYAIKSATDTTPKFVEVPNDGFFVADINWTDSSENEEYFEIDIAECDTDFDNSTTIDDDAWATAKANADNKGFKTVSTYNAKTFWASGASSVRYDSKVTSGDANTVVGSSLLASSTHAEFILELGKQYYARIRAVNDAGASGYTYISVPTNVSTDRKISGTTINYAKFTTSTINLFRITYDMNGGTYYEQGKNTTTGSTATVLKYFSRSSSDGVGLIDISGGACQTTTTDSVTTTKPTGETPTIILGTSVLTVWTDTSTGKQFVDSKLTDDTKTKKYTGYKNLYLKANAGSVAYTILDASTYAIDKTWITLTVGSNTVNSTSTTKIPDDQGSIEVASGGSSTVAINMTSGTGTWVYDSVAVKITKTGGSQYMYESLTGLSRDTAKSTSSVYLGSGIYTILIEGRYGNIVNSYQMTLTIKG